LSTSHAQPHQKHSHVETINDEDNPSLNKEPTYESEESLDDEPEEESEEAELGDRYVTSL